MSIQPLQLDVAGLVTTLIEGTQFWRGLDFDLRGALNRVLVAFGADAIVCRVGQEGDSISAFSADLRFRRDQKINWSESCRAAIDKNAHSNSLDVVSWIADPISGNHIMVYSSRKTFKNERGGILKANAMPFVAFVYASTAGQVEQSLGSNVNGRFQVFQECVEQISIVSVAILMAFEFRQNLNAIFSPNAVRRFWELVDDGALRNAKIRPWDDLDPLSPARSRTVTISLDLRRSTFAMDSATDKKAYADWMEGFVETLRRVTKENNGVFDKFTGDGVIAHFLVGEASVTGGISQDEKEAVKAAVKCGWEMIYAVMHLMERLRRILSLDNAKMGPSVGLAIDDAIWSVDRRGGPIVVGRGVVQACRANAGEAGTMQMTNAAFVRLEDVIGHVAHAERVAFETKEHAKDSGVLIVRLLDAPGGICRPVSQIHVLCEEVDADLQRRSSA
ncbi:MAG: hypothetical protein Q8M19_04805 [Reyranella sp.]|nr:hypothetical protein [Reyranella sp.]